MGDMAPRRVCGLLLELDRLTKYVSADLGLLV